MRKKTILALQNEGSPIKLPACTGTNTLSAAFGEITINVESRITTKDLLAQQNPTDQALITVSSIQNEISTPGLVKSLGVLPVHLAFTQDQINTFMTGDMGSKSLYHGFHSGEYQAFFFLTTAGKITLFQFEEYGHHRRSFIHSIANDTKRKVVLPMYVVTPQLKN